ncbi:response regulator [Diaphorobacter sp.]|uniref:response regulator n=1 Tax=Diaphorobacter sp. TaxID=1934310 RepID=UPI00258BED80|nr:response regulator [Diaphorobacter sp.]
MLSSSTSSLPAECSTRDVAQALGLAVRSVQLMVDRGELEAWKTPGGHRRISRASVERWLARRAAPGGAALQPPPLLEAGFQASSTISTSSRIPLPAAPAVVQRPSVLLIEDSVHFQTLVQLLLAHGFPGVDLHVADDGIVGLAMVGQLEPSVIIVDILLPGIDGATLVARLRTHPQFQRSQLIVITSLDESQRAPYAFALAGLPVVHKPRLAQDLPALLTQALAGAA